MQMKPVSQGDGHGSYFGKSPDEKAFMSNEHDIDNMGVMMR